jgi:TM2 domain-containing membrane protein YozV
MNCAVHTDVPAAAYCRTCGKALCPACERDVRGVIYCEDCIAKRLQDTMPAATTVGTASGAPAVNVPPVVVVPNAPNPGLAGVLAGFFPFGVGQVYNGQYSKGLAHLLLFALLIWGMNQGSGGSDAFFAFCFAGFYFYQIIDAVRSARALQVGATPPDPFGLGKLFGGQAAAPAAATNPTSASATGTGSTGTVATGMPTITPVQGGVRVGDTHVPTGAIVLIGLGLIFLLDNLGIFHWHWIGRLWPLILIALGLRIIFRNQWAGGGR